MRIAIIVSLAVIVGSVTALPDADARTWRVNAEGTGDAPSIGAALDSCAAGDSVVVAAGVYQIYSHLNVWDERVTLVSEAGAEATVLQRAAGPVALAIGSRTVVEGFTFNAVSVANTQSFTQGGRISNNIFRGSGEGSESAMIFWLHGGMTISGNCVCSFGETGIELSESTEFIFEHNTITACGTAIRLFGSEPWNAVRHNLIVGNEYGIDLGWGDVLWGISCNDVFGNSIADYVNGTDPTGTGGNISVDPEFCAVDPAGSGNFLLQSDSPCAPGNHPDGASCSLIGARPVGCGGTSVKRASWGSIKSHYR